MKLEEAKTICLKLSILMNEFNLNSRRYSLSWKKDMASCIEAVKEACMQDYLKLLEEKKNLPHTTKDLPKKHALLLDKSMHEGFLAGVDASYNSLMSFRGKSKTQLLEHIAADIRKLPMPPEEHAKEFARLYKENVDDDILVSFCAKPWSQKATRYAMEEVLRAMASRSRTFKYER